MKCAASVVRALILLTVASLAAAGVARADTFVTDFTKTDNIQSGLISTFPTGVFTPGASTGAPGNTFGKSFDIQADSNGNNFYAGFTFNGNGTLTITLAKPIAGVADVYTLMNSYFAAYTSVGQQLGTIEFVGSAGATQTFPLEAGYNIRDFYQGRFVNSLNSGLITGVTTENAFACNDPGNCLGAAGTGNVNTGSWGNYVIDEQRFALGSAFLGQDLTEIVLADTYNGAQPILLGMTAAGPLAATPEPSGMLLVLTGFGLLAGLAWKRREGIRLAGCPAPGDVDSVFHGSVS